MNRRSVLKSVGLAMVAPSALLAMPKMANPKEFLNPYYTSNFPEGTIRYIAIGKEKLSMGYFESDGGKTHIYLGFQPDYVKVFAEKNEAAYEWFREKKA